ncbi:hypothetical protein ACLB2K_045944 [Fragaria x ananassa]
MNNSELEENDSSDDLNDHEERTRRLNDIILEKKEESVTDVKSIALHTATAIPSGESSSPKVGLTYMDSFVYGLLLDSDEYSSHNIKPQFLEKVADEYSELKEDEDQVVIQDEKKAPTDGTIREDAIGKGLSDALNLLRDQRTLEVEEEKDKKKRKLIETTSCRHVAATS